MPTNIKKSTRIDLSALLEKLLESNVEYILVGGLALLFKERRLQLGHRGY